MLTIKNLETAAALLNLQELARLSGIPYQRLYAKVIRGSELRESEITAITAALAEKGLQIISDDSKFNGS